MTTFSMANGVLLSNYSLRPLGMGGCDDDGGKEYWLPDGFKLAESHGGSMEIYDARDVHWRVRSYAGGPYAAGGTDAVRPVQLMSDDGRHTRYVFLAPVTGAPPEEELARVCARARAWDEEDAKRMDETGKTLSSLTYKLRMSINCIRSYIRAKYNKLFHRKKYDADLLRLQVPGHPAWMDESDLEVIFGTWFPNIYGWMIRRKYGIVLDNRR
jgi:hypothetical protein